MTILRHRLRAAAGAEGAEGGGGGSGDDWKAQLPEDLQNDPTLKDVKDVPTLAKMATDSQKELGRRIRIPGEDASDDAKQEFYQKLQDVPGVTRIPDADDEEGWEKLLSDLGKPKDPDGYKLEVEGLDEKSIEQIKADAHAAGMTTKQAEAFAKQQAERQSKAKEQRDEQMRKYREQLKREWGEAYPKMERAAQEGLKEYGTEELVDLLNEQGILDDPRVVKAFAKIGESLGEDTDRGTGGPEGGITPDQAQDQINEIMNNKDHPYHDRRKPGHQDAVAKVYKLHQAKAAGK